MSITNLSLTNNTLTFDLTPTNINETQINISNIIPVDNSGIFSLNYTIEPVTELLFSHFIDTNTTNVISEFTRHVTYNITAVFNKSILNNTTFTVSSVTENILLATNAISFNWTPTINSETIRFDNITDDDGFLYSITTPTITIDDPPGVMEITGFSVNPEVIVSNKILLDTTKNYTITFTKNLQQNPLISLTNAAVSNINISNNTVSFDLNPTDILETTLVLSNIAPTDGSGPFTINYPVDPVNPIVFNGFTPVINYVKYINYTQTAQFSKALNSITSIQTINGNQTLTNTQTFDWMPQVANETIEMTVIDDDGFTLTLSTNITTDTYFYEYPDDTFLTTIPVGVHYDIEPHSLPGWSSNQQSYANQFLDLLEGSQSILNNTFELTVDAPIWYDTVQVTRNSITKPFSEWIQDIVDTYNILAFRETANDILSQTTVEKDYAENNNKKFSITVETDDDTGESETISFWEEGSIYMEGELTTVDSTYNSLVSYTGIIIHPYSHWNNMLIRDSPNLGINNSLVRSMYVWDTDIALSETEKTTLWNFTSTYPVNNILFEVQHLLPNATDTTALFINDAHTNGVTVELLFGKYVSALTPNHQEVYDWLEAVKTFSVIGRNYLNIASNSTQYITINSIVSENHIVRINLTGNTGIKQFRLVSDITGATYPSSKPYTGLANGSSLDNGETDEAVFFLTPPHPSTYNLYITWMIGLQIYTQLIIYNQ